MKEIVNERIKSEIVFLINKEGVAVGRVTREEALQKSKSVGLDLVLISSKGNGQPPICKILDYGKKERPVR